MNEKGVIGAGAMGNGVAHNLAQAKYNVILLDKDEETLEESKKEIYNNIRMSSLLNNSEDNEDPETILKRIQFTTDINELKPVDYVVECVSEIWEEKESVFKEIDSLCSDNCIFMTNTSCISVTKLASATNRPDKVIGTHFMNPVQLINDIEVIKGYHTSEETINKTIELLEVMGKKSIIVNDFPGFVSNRISHLFMNEAAFVVQDQVASPEDVDEIFKKCYGHKMGPLETADLIGLDTVVNSLDVLYESYQDHKFRCCPLLRKMVDAGLYGRKSGKGFYSYE